MSKGEGSYTSIDQILPVGNFSSKAACMPFLSYLFPLRLTGGKKIRRCKGFLDGDKKDFEVSPLSPWWLRSGIIFKK